jgi:hypothetical protein
MHRRTLLAAARIVLVSSYVANTTPSAGSEQADRGASAIEARSKSLAGRVSSGPVRSKGESTTVTETMSDGDNENIEYESANGTFRVGVAETADETRFEIGPFAEWMAIECAEAGAERARETTVDRLGTGGFHASSANLPKKSESLVVLLTVADDGG